MMHHNSRLTINPNFFRPKYLLPEKANPEEKLLLDKLPPVKFLQDSQGTGQQKLVFVPQAIVVVTSVSNAHCFITIGVGPCVVLIVRGHQTGKQKILLGHLDNDFIKYASQFYASLRNMMQLQSVTLISSGASDIKTLCANITELESEIFHGLDIKHYHRDLTFNCIQLTAGAAEPASFKMKTDTDLQERWRKIQAIWKSYESKSTELLTQIDPTTLRLLGLEDEDSTEDFIALNQSGEILKSLRI